MTNHQKRASARMAVAAVATTLLASGAAGAADAQGQTISVNVSGVRNTRGNVGCRLFSSPDGFPEEGANTRQVTLRATGATARCEFQNVPPGMYAIAVLHDENGNGRLDKNYVGVPKEGYGVSNNHTYALKQPKWQESSFAVERGKDLALAVEMRY